MGQLQPLTLLTEADYLNYEQQAEGRHELVGGQLYAMAGASEAHNLINGNLFFQLRRQMGSTSGCRIFSSDMKLKIARSGCFYYPDLMVVCEVAEGDSPYWKQHPCLLAEILSATTETVDRREKRLNYLQIPSLRYYLLIDSRRCEVEMMQRSRSGQWQQSRLESGEVFTIECGTAAVELTLASLYEAVEWEAV